MTELTFPIAMDAALLTEANVPFQMLPVELSAPRADEVLVKIVASGICHTDIAVRDGDLPSQFPAILGHEGSGIVVSVGASVTSVVPGDHVVMSYLSCGECKQCSSGNPASCANFGTLCFSGARPDGSHAVHLAGGAPVSDRFFGQSSFAPYAIAHERSIVKVRKDAPLELLGPLGCGIMTGAGAVWNALQLRPGSSFAVFGSGAVGLSAAMAAKVAGATTIVCIDPVPSRLAIARELGATHTVDARSDNVIEQVRAATGDGVDAILDTTGRADVIANALASLAQCGTLAVVAASAAAGPHLLPIMDMIMGCKKIVGVVEGGTSAQSLVPKLIDLYLAGRFPFDRLVEFYDLDQVNDAARDSTSGKAIKPILKCSHPV